ncbi:endothelin-converting enzyme 1-like isoform X2 [Paramacrobiotus metropolitanus]|uniref:endothelin-converting enzyme 1-like isoform X2 n=1 Tax=Paramacrobiotus metropolitanus TaxID=2943436 RepID=UPI00244565E8|nr:endothelin-converting enzyme 1-like isoform X2 [Paramacrobiotus metropolitanus]
MLLKSQFFQSDHHINRRIRLGKVMVFLNCGGRLLDSCSHYTQITSFLLFLDASLTEKLISVCYRCFLTDRRKTRAMLLLDAVKILVVAAAAVKATKRQPSSTVCTSDLCQLIAREIVSSMDETIDPCVDFFAYSCNRWNSTHGLVHNVLIPKISKQIQEMLASGNYTNPTEKKATGIYNQCINQTNERPFDDGNLLRTIEDLLGGWSLLKDPRNVSAFHLEEALVRLHQNGISTFSGLSVQTNEFSIEENILHFMMPGRLFKRWELDTLVNPNNKRLAPFAFAELLYKWAPVVQRLLKAANASFLWSTVKNRFEQALLLDFMLAKGPTGPVYYRERLTFGDLSRPPFRSQFLSSFLHLFNAMLKASSINYQATTATQLAVPDQFEYLLNLDQTMAQLEGDGDAGLTTLADWLWWTAVNHYHLIYRAKVLASEIANAVRDAVLLKTPWMDQTTKEAAMDRLNDTLLNVGFPEELVENWTLLDNYYTRIQVEMSFFDTLRTIGQSNSWINLQRLSRTNARNDPFFPADRTLVTLETYTQNRYIVIPAAVVQTPMFYASDMDILDYARMGFLIGHEFTHIIDIEVKELGNDGKPLKWWTDTTQNNYNARNYTLVDFYNSISTKNVSVDGRQTLIENTADNGGFQAAFLAFRNFMRRTGYRITLPGLETMDEKQLFWLTGAQAWCIRPPGLVDETHSPFRFRVMGPYINSPDFGASYNCPLGSPMSPGIKAC